MLNYIKTGIILLLFSLVYFCENIKSFVLEKLYPFLFKNQESIIFGCSIAFFAAILTFLPLNWVYNAIILLFIVLWNSSQEKRNKINFAFFVSYICTAIFCGLTNIFLNKLILLNVVIYYVALLFVFYCIKSIRSLIP